MVTRDDALKIYRTQRLISTRLNILIYLLVQLGFDGGESVQHAGV
jgi:hypothetical protein